VKLRYKQTLLGVIWVLVQPLVPALIFTFVFTRITKLDTGGTPYLVFSLSALTGWNFIARSVSRAGAAIVSESSLITKVYFPRLALPIANVIGSYVDLVAGLIVLAVAMAVQDVAPTLRLLLIPVFILYASLVALGVALWSSALSVRFRDVVNVLPFIVQVWLYASPVAYSTTNLSPAARRVFALNPATGVVEGLRWCVVGRVGGGPLLWSVGAVLSAVMLISGLLYFRATERNFADVV
jgi:lipopolysaccharide transport system permease protein